MIQEYNKELILEELQNYYNKNNSITSRDALSSDKLPHPKTVAEYFNTWNDALRVAGIPVQNKKEYTDDDIISALQEAEDEIIPLTSDKFDSHKDYPAKSTVSNKFGSWKEACEIAGVESGQVTKKSILQNIEKLYNSNEIANSEDFFTHSETISSSTFYKKFGGWREAIDEIDIDAHTHYTDEDLLEYIKQFEDEYGYISQRKFKYDDNYPSSTTLNRRWGSWNKAVKAAGIDPNEIGVAVDEEPSGLKNKLFGSNWYRQRENTLERDSYKCRNCESETNLCVHHDKPRVTYRKSNTFEIEESNSMDNLITLCENCHHSVHSGDITVSTPYPNKLQPKII